MGGCTCLCMCRCMFVGVWVCMFVHMKVCSAVEDTGWCVWKAGLVSGVIPQEWSTLLFETASHGLEPPD